MKNNNGWIDAEKAKPPFIEGKDYSENVWGWDGNSILVVSFFDCGDGFGWANAYGNVFGDTEYDFDYDIKFWKSIDIPDAPE